MNIDFNTLEDNLLDGSFRRALEDELTVGFRQIQLAGERLPVPSHYASQIAEIISRQTELSDLLKFELYQEVLLACEAAAKTVSGEVA
jgi:hypothetical protein